MALNFIRIFTEHIFSTCYMSSSVRPSAVCLSSVCNVRAPYSGDSHFRQHFFAIWYFGHLWPFGKNFTEIVPYKAKEDSQI